MDKKREKIIFVRSNSVNPDSRLEKEISYLSNDYKIEVLGWDRERKYKKVEEKQEYKIYRCQIKGQYGGGIKNLIYSILWFFYEFFWLISHSFEIIHTCDFDTYLVALIVAKIKRKKIVYDIFDFYAEMIIGVPDFLKKIIKKIDLFLIHFADGILIADENRIHQISDSHPKKLVIIYNTPPDFFEKYKENIQKSKNNLDFILGYVGLLQKERGFDYLIDLIKEMEGVKLVIGGFGPYEQAIKRKIKGVKNIEFLGKISPYEKTLEIESKFNVLFALYDPSVPNHRYSSPNKLFEAMMLQKPIIVTRDTGMDKIVEKYQCGIIVDYNNKTQLKKAILKLKENNNSYGKNGREAYLKFFHSDIMKNRLLQFYKEILAK